ncbi:hypothetical protein LCGC14_1957810 [marine sediment metagenome]|uniref:Uncharacterized protein n=1 Tax=marine sediment metagenome TaxID=412755 RepID=A0A0F9G3S9_9ZZZZ
MFTNLEDPGKEDWEQIWPWRSSTPHKCPVCEGRGDHMHGFYDECVDTSSTARVSCRACGEIFKGLTRREARKKHKQHVKTCESIKAIEKVERFRKEAEKILGRKMTFLEACYLLGAKK